MLQHLRPFIGSRLRRLSGLRANRRGNVLMIFGFAIVPITFATGMGIDYGAAMRLQTRLNAVADAAALAGVARPMMDKTDAEAATFARTVFDQQSTSLYGLILNPANITVTVVGAVNGTRNRQVTVSYRGQSRNSFSRLLGRPALDIGGTATAVAKAALNVDYYVMLDVSSSMALPTTTAGINFLRSKTRRTDYIWNPNGCAFACHQSNPDNPNVRDSSGKMIDYYTLAQLNGIELRIDAGKRAISDMMTRAQQTSQGNNATYRFSVSTWAKASDFVNVAPLTGSYATAKAQTATAQTVAVAMHANLYDRQTEPGGSMMLEKALMPTNPGRGTNQADDTPQAVMFLITDGMRDEESNGRQMGSFATDQCTEIKNRGIRLAVLYTTYTPESVNYDDWSYWNILWRLPDVPTALQSCASPGLYFEVSTDGSISDALNQLFDKTLETAHLSK